MNRYVVDWLTVQAGIKASATMLVFGLLVVSAGPRRPVNMTFAFFLFLVGANLGIEAIRAFVPGGFDSSLLARIAFLLAAADPFVLYYFAGLFPARNSLNDAWKVATVMGGGALFAFLAPLVTGASGSQSLSSLVLVAWEAYTLSIYGIVLGHFFSQAVKRDASKAHGWMYASLCLVCVALLPRMVRAFSIWSTLDDGYSFLLQVARVALPVAAGAALYGLWKNRTRRWSGAGLWGPLAGVGVALMIAQSSVLVVAERVFGLVPPIVADVASYSSPLGGPIRWISFTLAASVAFVRHDVLGMSVGFRRLFARVTLGVLGVVALLAVAGLMLWVGAWNTDGIGLAETIFVVAILVGSQSFRGMIDRLATTFYGIPMGKEAARGHYVMAAGRRTDGGEESIAGMKLHALGRDLGLSDHEVERLEDLAAMPASERPVPGRVIADRYLVERHLGRGGQGDTYLAQDMILQRAVVLKYVRSIDGSGERRAMVEARRAASVKHEAVVTILDVQPLQVGFLIVMEYVEGGNLARRVDAHGKLDHIEASRLLSDLLEAVGAIHDARIVHRDLKPANILVDQGGRFQVTDFGIAASADGDATMVPGSQAYGWGSRLFSAPEVLRGEAGSAASDIFSIGRILSACAACDIESPLGGLAARLVVAEPDQRPQTTDEVGRIAASLGLTVETRGTSSQSAARRRHSTAPSH